MTRDRNVLAAQLLQKPGTGDESDIPGQMEARLGLIGSWGRVAISLGVMIMAPLVNPNTIPLLWIPVVYLALGFLGMWLIKKQIGGFARKLGLGVVDLAFMLFWIQQIGTLSLLAVAAYLSVGVLFAVCAGPRAGIILAAVGSIAYLGVFWAESLGYIQYGPYRAGWAAGGPPNTGQATSLSLVLPVFFVGITWLVTRIVMELRRRGAELAWLSARDPLTELYNRRYLFDRLELELERVRRGHQLVILMIDLDEFKKINDQQGHRQGDRLLVAIGKALQETGRMLDIVGRYGGDEFLALLPDTPVEGARVVAQRVVDVVREAAAKLEGAEGVTASVGLTSVSGHDTAETALQRADGLVYRAKREGGDRFTETVGE